MLKKLIAGLQDFFGLSRKEARGALVLIVLCFGILWLPFVFRRWILPALPIDTGQPDLIMLDSLAARLEAQTKAEHSRKDFRKPYGDYKNKVYRKIRLFDFDPNTASQETLSELGIPFFLVKRMIRFREKGGRFSRKEDLLKIYDFPPDLYKKLESHLVFEKRITNPETGKSISPPVSVRTFPAKPVITAFDINTADTTRLIRLKGIGTRLALRILKFRDGLGGFHSTGQFQEIFGLDSVALEELERYALIGSPVKKLEINTADADMLASHPYLRNRKLTTVIVNYRSQHGPFKDVDDLKKVRVMDENVIRKIKPYLAF